MRTTRAAKNVIASLLYKIVALICGLIVPRLMLSHFGSEYNGVVASATQFMNYITILTIGIAGPTRVALYDSLARHDEEKTNGILKATSVYMQKFSIAIVLYASLIMILLPQLAHTSLPAMEVALLVVIVSFSMFVDYFFTVTNHTLLSADQREYIFDITSTITVIANCIVIYALIKLGYGIIRVRFVSALVFLLKPVIIALFIKRNYRIDRKVASDYSALKERGDAAATSIANLIHDNIDLVILTFFVDIKLVSVYTVYNMIATQMRSVMQIFTGGLEAGFGNIIARDEKETLQRSFKIYEYLVFGFVSVVISCAFVLILPFIRNYTEGVHDIDYIIPSFAFLMVLCEATYCIRQPYVTIVQAAGKYRETRNGAIIEAVLNVILSLIFVWLIGFQGVIVGTIFANIFRSVQYCIYVYKNILDKKKDVVLYRIIWCIVNIMIICFCSKLILYHVRFLNRWMLWVLHAGITLLLAVFVTLISSVMFYKSDLSGMKETMLRVVKH